ncbi:MAG TPA: phosphoribosyltransferase [Thermoplasmata archaeon]|nr:phosphoribosyltransferase [Thermoplasmata archaeon]HUJ78622.1 phosphoribosyltransferase [Thermoplasmata archaeon]
MADFPRCRVASWADIDGWADRLGAAIVAADRTPDTIVGLTRGGWVGARLLADRLGVRRLLALRAQHWGVTATPDGTASIPEAMAGDIAGEAVLVVDDITDTGESLALAASHVAERQPSRLETATFLHITHSTYRPTYVAEEIPRESWVWVVFPWNYWEDLATLGRRAVAEAGSADAGARLLRERTGWATTVDEIERALRIARAPRAPG